LDLFLNKKKIILKKKNHWLGANQ